MKALLVSQPNKFELVDMPRPVCGPGQVVIRTAYCGICGTDIDILRGKASCTFLFDIQWFQDTNGPERWRRSVPG